MAASASRNTDRMIQQDYIARIRYSNALPPPPNPPKLLDIPNTGLASGQYTTPGFASRLAREQPLNIEADAELGMPLDLVGMPGVFDGDESSIQAPLHPGAPHPHDRPLLRSLRDLGRPRATDAGVSFLRRTEYISSGAGKARFESTPRSLANPNTKLKRPAPPVDTESPEFILSEVEKSFEVTAQNLKEPGKVRHPTKRNVKLIESVPLIPDLEAIPDPGGYVVVKFASNPVPPSNVYDIRLESGILRPQVASDEQTEAREAAIAAWERDPDHNPYPEPEQNYEFFLAESATDAAKFKRKCDVLDPERDDDDLYTFENQEGVKCFRFKRIRAYETAATVDMQQSKYNEEILIAVNHGTDKHHQRAAYYYPLIQRATIRPQRKKNIDRLRFGAQEEESDDMVDLLDLTVRDADEEEARQRRIWAEDPYHVDEPVEEEGAADASASRQNGDHGEEANGRDRDAEGEDEDVVENDE